MRAPLLRSRAALSYLVLRGVRSVAAGLFLTTLTLYYVAVVGMGAIELVLAGAVFELAILLCEVPTGAFADSYGRRRSILIGLFLFGAALLAQGAVPLLAVVLLTELIAGAGDTFLTGATDAWLADEVGEEQVAPIYVRAAQIDQVAALAGMPLGVALATLALNLPLLVAGTLYVGLCAALALWMPERGFRPVPAAEAGRSRLAGTLLASARVVRGSRVLQLLLVASLFGGAASEGFDRLWELQLLVGQGFPAVGALSPAIWFGVVSGAMALVGLVVLSLARGRLVAAGRDPALATRLLVAIAVALMVSVLLFALAESFALALAALLLRSALGALAAPLLQTWIVRQAPAPLRATVVSLSSQAHSLGEVAGGPLAGAVVAGRSLRAGLVVAGLLLAPVAGLYAATLRRRADAAEPVDQSQPA